MSFKQARDAENTRKRAAADAKTKMDSARAELEKNYMAALSVPMEAYEQEQEALLTAGATAMQAGIEGGQRGAGAVAGRVLQGTQAGAAAQRTAMAQDLYNLDAATAEEQSRLRDIGVSLDMEEASGAQATAANAEFARANAMMQGIQSTGSAVQQGFQAVPLYKENKAASQQALQGIDAQMKSDMLAKSDSPLMKQAQISPTGFEFNTDQFDNKQMRQFNREVRQFDKQLMTTPQFYQNYNEALEGFGGYFSSQFGTTIADPNK